MGDFTTATKGPSFKRVSSNESHIEFEDPHFAPTQSGDDFTLPAANIDPPVQEAELNPISLEEFLDISINNDIAINSQSSDQNQQQNDWAERLRKSGEAFRNGR